MINDSLNELEDLRREHARLKAAYAFLKADYERLRGKVAPEDKASYIEPKEAMVVVPFAPVNRRQIATDCLATLRAELAKIKP
jgi:hypothetical protein